MDTKTLRLVHLIKQAQEKYSDDHLVLAVPGLLSKKFIAYCSMKEDLELIIQYINELKYNSSGVIKSALSYSLISLYGKCFMDASESSYPELEPSDPFKDGEENSETHEYLINLRHKFIAHRGETENEIGISYMLVPKKDNLDKTQVRFTRLKLTGFSEKDLARIETLVKYIIESLLKKIQKSGQKVHDRMLNSFTPEQLTLMLMNGAK